MNNRIMGTERRWKLPNLARLVLVAILVITNAALSKTAEAKSASFVDDFKTFSTARWYVSDGWTNGDHQNCGWSKDQIRLDDGKLRIGFEKRPKAERLYRCGEIQTKQKFSFGTYEARVKTPAGTGLNANFFTFSGGNEKEPHNEIDFEFLLKDTLKTQLNSFVDGKGGNEYMAALAQPSDDGFTDLAMSWSPGLIEWYIDGKLVHTIDDPTKVPNRDMKIFLSLWGTDTLTDWMGKFEDPGKPIALEVDRVAYTALGAACQFPQSIVCGRED